MLIRGQAMKLRLTPTAIAGISILAAFTVFITWRAKLLELKSLHVEEASALVGKQAPDFSLTSIEGKPVSLADYREKKSVVVAFWASWCGPCRLELPDLSSFYTRNSASQASFEILAISVDDDRGDALKFASEAKLPFPVLWDRAGKVGDSFGVSAIPALFVINGEGKIIYAQTGFEPGLDAVLARQLGLPVVNPFGDANDAKPSH